MLSYEGLRSEKALERFEEGIEEDLQSFLDLDL